MGTKGVIYQINNAAVPSPDEEVWSPIVIGTSLSGTQKRSPYRTLEWRMQVGDACDLSWFDYDNMILSSLTTRPPTMLDEFERYTDAICQSVTMRQVRGNATEIVAVFQVYVG